MGKLSKKYDHKQVETGKYEFWLNNGFFKADASSHKPRFSIVLPPPNVTGMLHLGHAWDGTLQDIIVRRKRMQGYDTLWLPGTDHAGIATQAKVEERLQKEGTNRHVLGREKFLERAYAWKEEYAAIIHKQWAKLGLSLDYSRERFTLDEGFNQAVNYVFVKLYEKGLIYRGERIINWDPVAQTALSNIEVEHKEVEGAMYYFKYVLEDNPNEYIPVATTRPETMFGDTAVAVHPKDERYRHLIGKRVLIPGSKKPIPVIADEYVDPEFGTGAVKITPAHDPNDFEVGNRHQLERIIVMNKDATMNEHALKYAGMDRFECRKQLVKDLQEEGLLIKIEKIVHQVGHSQRTHVMVEPYLSEQWFVKMKPLAEAVIENQKNPDTKVRFFPERFEKILLNWMNDIQDWCISRQLWWGHRIPAYYHKETGEVVVSMTPPEDIENYVQDEDVLDTWFSSALWPFAALGWPDTEAKDYKRYFPTDVLVTGYDIIFFWVARMIFQSLEFTGQRPFKDVLIHGMFLDSQGRIMSKSLGNGVDPMEVIERYGCDALRHFISTNSAPGADQRFMEEKLEASWNFINKIWNAANFVLMNIDENMTTEDIRIDTSKLNVSDRYILHRLNETIERVDYNYDKYEFGEAMRYLYHFIWEDYCSWYIEMSKLTLQGDDEAAKKQTQSVLVYVLDKILKLLHPFMPFVTEEIYQAIPHDYPSIMISDWPTIQESYFFPKDISAFELLRDVIKAVRTIRAEVNVPLSKPIDLYIRPTNDEAESILTQNQEFLYRFCNPNTLIISQDVSSDEEMMTSIVTNAEILVPLKELIDIDQEIDRLEQEAKKLESEVQRCERMLSNPNFLKKAPEAKVEEERRKLQDYLSKYETVIARLKELKAMKN